MVELYHFFSICLEILTWFLIYEYIMMSYRSSLYFVPVQWFLAELWTLKFGQIYSPSPLYFTMIWDIDLIFSMRVYNHKLQINFESHLLFLAYYWGNQKSVKHLQASLIFTVGHSCCSDTSSFHMIFYCHCSIIYFPQCGQVIV